MGNFHLKHIHYHPEQIGVDNKKSPDKISVTLNKQMRILEEYT